MISREQVGTPVGIANDHMLRAHDHRASGFRGCDIFGTGQTDRRKKVAHIQDGTCRTRPKVVLAKTGIDVCRRHQCLWSVETCGIVHRRQKSGSVQSIRRRPFQRASCRITSAVTGPPRSNYDFKTRDIGGFRSQHCYPLVCRMISRALSQSAELGSLYIIASMKSSCESYRGSHHSPDFQ